jgi:hypothetical protein
MCPCWFHRRGFFSGVPGPWHPMQCSMPFDGCQAGATHLPSKNSLSGDVSESASLDAPLPVIGLRGLWSLTHDLWFEATAQYFALSIGDYDGNLQDYRASVTWQPRRWLGIGVGYERFTVDVDVDKDDFNGSLDWTYDGPMIFYNASF